MSVWNNITLNICVFDKAIGNWCNLQKNPKLNRRFLSLTQNSQKWSTVTLFHWIHSIKSNKLLIKSTPHPTLRIVTSRRLRSLKWNSARRLWARSGSGRGISSVAIIKCTFHTDTLLVHPNEKSNGIECSSRIFHIKSMRSFAFTWISAEGGN